MGRHHTEFISESIDATGNKYFIINETIQVILLDRLLIIKCLNGWNVKIKNSIKIYHGITTCVCVWNGNETLYSLNSVKGYTILPIK